MSLKETLVKVVVEYEIAIYYIQLSTSRVVDQLIARYHREEF